MSEVTMDMLEVCYAECRSTDTVAKFVARCSGELPNGNQCPATTSDPAEFKLGWRCPAHVDPEVGDLVRYETPGGASWAEGRVVGPAKHHVGWLSVLVDAGNLLHDIVGREWDFLPRKLRRIERAPVDAGQPVPPGEPDIRLPHDPLDVMYDGKPLRRLLAIETDRLRSELTLEFDLLTAPQRAAVAEHWSAELRRKVAASAAARADRERRRVTVDPADPDGDPW